MMIKIKIFNIEIILKKLLYMMMKFKIYRKFYIGSNFNFFGFSGEPFFFHKSSRVSLKILGECVIEINESTII